MGVMRHSFSHFHLDIIPVPVMATEPSSVIMEGESFVWYNDSYSASRGMAAPVKRLLATLVNKVADRN